MKYMLVLLSIICFIGCKSDGTSSNKTANTAPGIAYPAIFKHLELSAVPMSTLVAHKDISKPNKEEYVMTLDSDKLPPELLTAVKEQLLNEGWAQLPDRMQTQSMKTGEIAAGIFTKLTYRYYFNATMKNGGGSKVRVNIARYHK